MRIQLITTVDALADKKFQPEKWGVSEDQNGFYRDFDGAVHFLFDDACLNCNPQGAIGEVLLNEEEAQACEMLTRSIVRLLDKYGNNLKDREYLERPEWDEIIENAARFKKILSS